MSDVVRIVTESYPIEIKTASIQIPGGGSTTPDYYTAENKDVSTLLTGTVASRHTSGSGVIRASASDNGKHGVGLVQSAISQGVAGNIQTYGHLTLSDWSGVTGSTTLQALAQYYLDVSAGRLTATPPTTGGTITQLIGLALSPTVLEIRIDAAILN